MKLLRSFELLGFGFYHGKLEQLE